MDKKKVEGLIRQLLIELGEDPDREGLLRTPKRVAESFGFLSEMSNAILFLVSGDLVGFIYAPIFGVPAIIWVLALVFLVIVLLYRW